MPLAMQQIRKINIGTRDTVHVVALNNLGCTLATGIAVSPDGTLYVADLDRSVIIKVFESGTINGTVVGKINQTGNVNSTNIQADYSAQTPPFSRIAWPNSICVDWSNNIYFIDGTDGPVIRRMSPSGTVALLAGNYDHSGDVVNALTGDYDNTKSRFQLAPEILDPFAPDQEWWFSGLGMGLAVDKAGIVYLADTGNHKIKKIWPDGRTTSMAGSTAGFSNGVGQSTQFNNPWAVCVDKQGSVYVADMMNNRIRKITESGVVTTVAGNGTAGFTDSDNGMAATFYWPIKICIDPSNQAMYVMDIGNNAIRKVMISGKTTTFCHFNPAISTTPFMDICMDNSGFLYILEPSS